MMTIPPISRRKARVTVRVAAKGGRRQMLGKQWFAYDGERVELTSRSGTLLSEGTVTAIEATGREAWKITLENGDVWQIVVGCGCGGG